VLLKPLTMDEFYGYWGRKALLGAGVGVVVGVVVAAAVCAGTVGVGCVAGIAAGAALGGAVGGYVGARSEGASRSSAALFGLKSGAMGAGAALTAGGLALAAGGAAAGGGALALAGGGAVGAGGTAAAGQGLTLAGVGAAALWAGGRAEVAYSRADRTGGGSQSANGPQPRDPSRIKSNAEANKIAADRGYGNAEKLKKDAANLTDKEGTGGWNIYRDKDGSLWVAYGGKPSAGDFFRVW
jgi:hypothetical protein